MNQAPAVLPEIDLTRMIAPEPGIKPLFTQNDYQFRDGWQLIIASTADSKGSIIHVYYDPMRVREGDDHITRLWLKYVTTRNGVEQLRDMALTEWRCGTAQTRTLSDTTYPQIPGRRRDTHLDTWEYVVPETLGEGIFRVFCQGEPDPEETEMRMANLRYENGMISERDALAKPESRQSSLESALSDYEMALELAPHNATVLDAIARVHKLLGK